MSGQIFVARTSGVITLDGERVVISAGHTRVREGHPLLDGNEELFEPLSVHYDVEHARQNPGEKRDAVKTAAPAPAETPETPEGAKPKRARGAAKKAAAKETGEK